MQKIQNVITQFKKIPWVFRAIGTLVLGSIIWILLVVPFITRIPKNFSYNANVVSVDNFYDASSGEYKGEQYSKTTFEYATTDATRRTVSIQNNFEVRTLGGDLIFGKKAQFTVDRFSQKVLNEDSPLGYLISFRHVKKHSLPYWYVSIDDAPITMNFIGTEHLYGVRVFKYESAEGGVIDQTKALDFLPGVPEKKGVRLEPKVTIWIEPISGHLVKWEDRSERYYFYDIKTGKEISPYNKFVNSFREESVREHVETARIQKIIILFLTWGIPILALLIFLILLLNRKINLLQKIRTVPLKKILPHLALIASLLISVTTFLFVRNSMTSKAVILFEQQTEEVIAAITDRFNIYQTALTSGKGLFDASDTVNREEWKTFIESFNINDQYPGIQGIGFSKVVPPSEKESFIASIRNEGFSNFSITPPGNRSLYTSIVYLEPFNERNQRAFGYDMFSEQTRREAMIRARDSKNPALSGKVTLLQESGQDQQPGFLVYVPVFSKTSEKTIVGYVYSPFRMNDFINGTNILKNLTLDFSIHDGLITNSDDNFLYSSIQNVSDTLSTTPSLKKQSIIYIAGRPWTFEFTANKSDILSVTDRWFPFGLLIMGTLISFLIYWILIMLVTSEQKSRDYANKLTGDLQQSNKRIEDQNKILEGKVGELERLNDVMVGRELAMIELKKKISQP